MNVNLHLQHKTHWREIPITSRNKVLDKSVDASCGYPLLDVNATKIIFYTSIHIICCSFVGEHDFWMPSFQCLAKCLSRNGDTLQVHFYALELIELGVSDYGVGKANSYLNKVMNSF